MSELLIGLATLSVCVISFLLGGSGLYLYTAHPKIGTLLTIIYMAYFITYVIKN